MIVGVSKYLPSVIPSINQGAVYIEEDYFHSHYFGTEATVMVIEFLRLGDSAWEVQKNLVPRHTLFRFHIAIRPKH